MCGGWDKDPYEYCRENDYSLRGEQRTLIWVLEKRGNKDLEKSLRTEGKNAFDKNNSHKRLRAEKGKEIKANLRNGLIQNA